MSVGAAELLYMADASPFGIIVEEVENIELLKQHLYKIKKERPEFSHLSFLTSPTAPTTELWIVKKATTP